MFKAIVYHGRGNHQNVKEDIVFFSSSETFSKNYGVVRPYQLRLIKPFDTCLKGHRYFVRTSRFFIR